MRAALETATPAAIRTSTFSWTPKDKAVLSFSSFCVVASAVDSTTAGGGFGGEGTFIVGANVTSAATAAVGVNSGTAATVAITAAGSGMAVEIVAAIGAGAAGGLTARGAGVGGEGTAARTLGEGAASGIAGAGFRISTGEGIRAARIGSEADATGVPFTRSKMRFPVLIVSLIAWYLAALSSRVIVSRSF